MEKTGEKRPWKSQERFPLSHSFNNNKLDDRDHFQQNAKTSVASLRGLIGSSRNLDRHHSGMLIDFIGIPTRYAQITYFTGCQTSVKSSMFDLRSATTERLSIYGNGCTDWRCQHAHTGGCGSTMSRTYDLFEVMPDGDLIWRAKIEGHESAVHELQQAAKRSANEFRLMHLPSMTVIAVTNAKTS